MRGMVREPRRSSASVPARRSRSLRWDRRALPLILISGLGARLRLPSAFTLIELDFIWITNRMTLR